MENKRLDLIRYLLDTRNRLKALAEKTEKHLAHLLPKDGTPITWEDDGVSYKIWYDHGVRMNSWSPNVAANVKAGKGPILGPPT